MQMDTRPISNLKMQSAKYLSFYSNQGKVEPIRYTLT